VYPAGVEGEVGEVVDEGVGKVGVCVVVVETGVVMDVVRVINLVVWMKIRGGTGLADDGGTSADPFKIECEEEREGFCAASTTERRGTCCRGAAVVDLIVGDNCVGDVGDLAFVVVVVVRGREGIDIESAELEVRGRFELVDKGTCSTSGDVGAR
jgi:hypothetical protein